MIVILLALPVLGLLTGILDESEFINKRHAIIVFVVCLILISLSLCTDISFSADYLDWSIVGIGFFIFGLVGSKPKKIHFKSDDLIAFVVRKCIAVFYISLPVLFVYLLYIALRNNWIGNDEKVETCNSYKIIHRCINSNLVYAGTHKVNVYEQGFVFEYPVTSFDLGEYDQMNLSYTFRYDPSTKHLILYRYLFGKYEKVKQF